MTKNYFDNSPSLFIQTGEDKSQMFGMNFARDVRHFVLRGTGGCGLMSEKDAVGMRNLRLALSGQSDDGSEHPRFSGFCLFGGTRMLRKDDPTAIVPGITEVFPAISKHCPDAALLGVIVKAGHLKYTPFGLVVHDEPQNPYVTIVHPTQTSSVILQPSSDSVASWDDEWKECVRICDSLRQAHWGGLLLVYNGGGVTNREVRTWAKLGKTDPFWQVLIVKGSGRVADEFATDEEFLEEHRDTVHVCENTVEDMRAQLLALGAITLPNAPQPSADDASSTDESAANGAEAPVDPGPPANDP
jgi:hypothetical protein